MDSRPWDMLNSNMGAYQTINRIESWIAQCDKGHKFCHGYGEEPFFPTRIIDVQNVGDSTLHLRDRTDVLSSCHDDKLPPYWTLSHRWGNPNNMFKLLQTNEGQMKQGISPEHLPKTFQDVASLLRQLGYRYIWIDSLSIFQDKPEDWQKEADSMTSIYRNSLCNISAISSSYDTSQGLFNDRYSHPRLLYPMSFNFERYSMSGTIWNEERFLSSRVVHFACNQVYWECLQATRCEADPGNQLALLNDIDILPLGSGSIYKKPVPAQPGHKSLAGISR
ncbi:heterokaryon incompatibility protein-domain-containing protein [Aspergillus bertholletiae]|uniref:Heterokaryon incompatibility protein-domain-containing protein n=1 Tax=Aspergillus bertholletiae TaxID=1226010 RepID=A0A5N7B5L3_9EURO|nr:heterokaryon incompatibility protein-domain-containing protein [Aspergillus bertholletiae]